MRKNNMIKFTKFAIELITSSADRRSSFVSWSFLFASLENKNEVT